MATKEQIKGKSTGEGVLKYFQNISAERKNGIFVLRTKEGKEIQVLFFDGKIVYAESDVKNRDKAILRFLVESGVIDKKIKTKILKRKEKARGLSIVTLLLEEKPGAEDEIGKCLRTRTHEILIEILMAEEITFEFIEKGKAEIGFNPKVYRPMNTDSTIFEAARIVDELKNALESSKVFQNIPALIETPDKEILRTLRVPEEFIEYIDGKSAIIEIARKAKVTVYEAINYISELLKNGVAEIEGVKEFPLEEEGDKKRDIIKLALKNFVAFFTIGLLGMSLYATFISQNMKKEKIKLLDPIEEIKIQKQIIKIKTVIEAYKMMEGKYPESILSTAEKGLIEKKDLTFPINRLYYYKRSDDGTYYELGL